MQRGRGRGRGTNPNSARSTSRRGHQSRGRRGTQSRARSQQSNTRRSARLAQLLDENAEANDPAAESSMADVARPRPLENRAARPRHHNNHNPGRSRSGPPTASPEAIRYAMDVIVQPPPTARAGQPLTRAIVVRLRSFDADPDDAIEDSKNLVAVANLVPGPNSTGSTDPAVLNTLLAGRRFYSINAFSDDNADGSIASMEMDNGQGVGYTQFPELVIRQAGTYRIRITLIRIRDSSSDPPVSSAAGGASIQIIDSNPIVVQADASSSNMAVYNGTNGEVDENDDGGWLEVLRAMQTRQRSPTR